ncbi:MAG: LCP family protein [Acidaminococcaceae bacterium]
MKYGSKFIAISCAVVITVGYLLYAFFTGEPLMGSVSLDDLGRGDRLSLKKNIVVMGVDERSGDAGRSDTLFVVMFDSKNDHVSLLSVPRDTMVKIPKHGWDKINHAFAYGGYRLTRQTVEEFLGIQINNYVVIDFKGFKRIIDAIGGIDIVVEKAMYYEDPYDDLVIDLEAGPQHLDGEKAIQYVRYRDEEGDIGRIKRQQQFIAAAYNKINSTQILTKVPAFIHELSSMIETDMPLTDMAMMGKAMHKTMKSQDGLSVATVPGEPVFIDEVSYWVPDMTDLREQMVEMQGAKMSDKYRLAAEKYEAEYKKVVPDEEIEVKKDTKTDKNIKIIRKPTLKDLQRKATLEDKEGSTKEKKTGSGEPAKPWVEQGTVPQTPTPPVVNTQKRTLSLKIINCSGKGDGVLAKAERLAESAGFYVVSTGVGERSAVTQVVATSADGAIVSKMASLPFSYSLRIVRDPEAGVDGIVYVGEDFN